MLVLPGCGSFLPEVLVDRAEKFFLVGAGREPVEFGQAFLESCGVLLVFGGRVSGVEFVEEPGAGFLVDAQGLEEREGVGFKLRSG